MSPIIGDIIVLLLLMVANGAFAMSEMAIVSASKPRLQGLKARGDRGAAMALALANNPNKILSTVQIGITLIGIFAGAFGGARLAGELGKQLDRLPLLDGRGEGVALNLVVICITYLSLVVGELVPKRLALQRPEQIAVTVARPLRSLSTLASPAVRLLNLSTDTIVSIISPEPANAEPEVTRTQIKVLIEQGTEEGTFQAAEQDMVERVLHLGDRPVSSIMTPRPEIVWLDLNHVEEVNRRKIAGSKHTHFPVCKNSLDEVLGIVPVSDLVTDILEGHPFDLATALEQPLFVPESTPGLKVLESFKQTHSHMALVVDEYGVVQGVVTPTNFLEAIVGDLPKLDAEAQERQAVQRDDGSWLLDGTMSMEEFRELFDREDFSCSLSGSFNTLGGFVITYLGRIPSAADCFECEGLRFEVMDMDGSRVDKVLVTRATTLTMPIPDNGHDDSDDR